MLYSGAEKEYKQAKLKAAETLKAKFLPANVEVALELDRIAEEREGAARKERLIKMRREAFELMKILRHYDPVLVGSVWRGTLRQYSDIDILVHHDEPADVLAILRQANSRIMRAEQVTVTKRGIRKGSFHIYLELSSKESAEIRICDLEELQRKEKCEIYGDMIVGLRISELEKLLSQNPTCRFVPF